jgi:hypothetical protein
MSSGIRYVADRDARRKNSLRCPNFLDPIFELPQRHLQAARKLASLAGRRLSARHPLVQASAHHALEIACRSVQGRLRYVQAARGCLERPAVCDRGKRTDVGIRDLVLHRLGGLAPRKGSADGRIGQRRLNEREQAPNPR